MASQEQIAANRLNAEKSTGPRTEAGQQRSALNALRHGLTGQVVVLPQEDIQAYTAFSAAMVEHFAPEGPVEVQLAQSYANCQWRINRVASLEDNMFSLGIMEGVADNLNIEHPEVHIATSHARTFRQEANEFQKLSMYATRLVNQSVKILKQLKDTQLERQQREDAEMIEALCLYQSHLNRNAVFDPQEIGFVLPLAKIQSAYRRKNL